MQQTFAKRWYSFPTVSPKVRPFPNQTLMNCLKTERLKLATGMLTLDKVTFHGVHDVCENNLLLATQPVSPPLTLHYLGKTK